MLIAGENLLENKACWRLATMSNKAPVLMGRTRGGSVWSVARLHAVSGMVSVGTQLKHNRRV